MKRNTRLRYEQYIAEANLWQAAIYQYIEDAENAVKGVVPRIYGHDDNEALIDLYTDQKMLAHLCSMVGMDSEAMGDRIKRRVEKLS